MNNGTKVDVAGIGADSRRDVAGIGADSRRDVAGITADSRENVATITQGGANYRHDTVSGDTSAREAGSDRRLTRNLDFGLKKLNTDSADRRYGVDVGASTARRGQDVTSETTRRGQDITQGTTQRGQDIRSKDSRYGADKRGAMYQNLFGATPITLPPGAMPAAPLEGTGTPLPAGPGQGGGVPLTQTPITAPVVKPSVITPPAATPPVQPQSADAPADKEMQRRSRFEQIKQQIAERQKKGQDITDLVRQLQQLRSGGGL
jgi:hypothetical protein